MDLSTALQSPVDFALAILHFILSLWWIYVPIILFLLVKDIWLKNARRNSTEALEWVLLEVIPPKEIEKTPYAMEQIFGGLHGFQSNPNWWERKIQGKVQDHFSFEMIGQSGDIRFFVRTLSVYRNFVEAQIYAQFPQAEIAEVDHYVQSIPRDVPSSDYDLWGTELMLTKEEFYPIRTYKEFERDAKQKEQRVDPLASISEILAKLQSAEQIWIQTLLRPIDHKWQEKAEKERDKLIGRKEEKKEGMIAKEISAWGKVAGEELGKFAGGASEDGGSKSGDKNEFEVNPMDYMTKIEKDSVTAIEEKANKIGFETIIRFLYLAPTTVFAKPNAGGIIGCYKLFSTQVMNGFRPNPKVTTKLDYKIQLKKPREFGRKRKILASYQKRDFVAQSEFINYLRPLNFERLPIMKRFFIKHKPFILNIEEIASIYHYPGLMAEAPTLPRVEAKRGGPPSGLPVK